MLELDLGLFIILVGTIATLIGFVLLYQQITEKRS